MGTVVIVAWSAGLDTVTSYAPALTTVKFNTAVGLALIGLSLVALRRDKRTTSQVAAAVYGLVGLVTLIEYAAGRSLCSTTVPGSPTPVRSLAEWRP
jgi:hypothetical protein